MQHDKNRPPSSLRLLMVLPNSKAGPELISCKPCRLEVLCQEKSQPAALSLLPRFTTSRRAPWLLPEVTSTLETPAHLGPSPPSHQQGHALRSRCWQNPLPSPRLLCREAAQSSGWKTTDQVKSVVSSSRAVQNQVSVSGELNCRGGIRQASGMTTRGKNRGFPKVAY